MWIQFVLRDVTNEIYIYHKNVWIHQERHRWLSTLRIFFANISTTDTKAGAMDTQRRAPWPHGK